MGLFLSFSFSLQNCVKKCYWSLYIGFVTGNVTGFLFCSNIKFLVGLLTYRIVAFANDNNFSSFFFSDFAVFLFLFHIWLLLLVLLVRCRKETINWPICLNQHLGRETFLCSPLNMALALTASWPPTPREVSHATSMRWVSSCPWEWAAVLTIACCLDGGNLILKVPGLWSLKKRRRLF